MSDPLESFYNEHLEKLKLVANGSVNPRPELKSFYLDIYNRKWKKNIEIRRRLQNLLQIPLMYKNL